MKDFISKAPLFFITYISLILILISSQFDNPVRELFPEFHDQIYDISNNIADALQTTTYKYSTLGERHTINVFAPIETGDIVEDTKIITLSDSTINTSVMEPVIAIKEPTPTPEPEPEEPQDLGPFYIQSQVDQSYFDDALFIGDSRTVGLCLYSGWENTDFLADVGLTIYGVLNKEITYNNGNKMYLSTLLSSKRYSKIYLMLGINEVGTGTSDSFCEAYAEVVDQILRWQPNAVVIVQSIMCVGPQKSATSSSINNNNIRTRNEKLATLQNDWNIFYLDINPPLCDGNGDLISEYSFDQVHLYAKYYTLWCDYLMQHGFIVNPAYYGQ